MALLCEALSSMVVSAQRYVPQCAEFPVHLEDQHNPRFTGFDIVSQISPGGRVDHIDEQMTENLEHSSVCQPFNYADNTVNHWNFQIRIQGKTQHSVCDVAGSLQAILFDQFPAFSLEIVEVHC